MTWLAALLLGILEGLTEFLPVSSTGHLILAKRALGLTGEGVDAFLIVIQLGALLAAVLYYRRTLWSMTTGLLRSEPQATRLFVALCLGSLPALCLGYLLGNRIEAVLFGPRPVAAALVGGGVIMILVDRWHRRRAARTELEDLAPRQVLTVGLCQAAALWPGTSRSMASIVGGQIAGLSNAAAADLSFLLAIPTLGAATVYKLWKSHDAILRDTGGVELAVGLLASFVVGWIVIAAFLRFLRRFGLGAFGYYRIAVGLVVFAVM